MSEKKYVLGIDCGTTSTRAVVFDSKGYVMGVGQEMNPLYYPQGYVGRIECKGDELIDVLYSTTRTALSRAKADHGVKSEEIAGISFTMFRCTMMTRDAKGGFTNPIIMWQDMRAGDMIDVMDAKLKAHGMDQDQLYDTCLMPISACLPSTKLQWLMKNVPEAYENAARIHTTMGLIVKAFGADDYYDDFATTPWLQLNDETLHYSKKLCEVFDVDYEKLAPLRKTGETVGYVTEEVAEKTGLAVGTPLIMGIGDQQSGVLGLGCVKEGMGYACGGTAGVTAGRSDNVLRDPQRKCYIMGTPDGAYEMEGQSNSAGSAFKWFKENTCSDLEQQERDVYDLMTAEASESTPGSNGVFYLPYLAGANTPKYDNNARGTLIGMTLSHKRSDLIRSLMEGICFDLKDMFSAMEDANVPKLNEIRVTGGIARSDLWNQIQADIYNLKVVATEYEEATVLGSAIIAAVGSGMYDNYQQATENMVRIKKVYEPIAENVETYKKAYGIWGRIFDRLSKFSYDEIADFQN